jgi:hypothetical protein
LATVKITVTPLIAAILMSPQHGSKPASTRVLPPPATVFQELFGVAVPKGVKIVRHHEDGPGMDPSFAWEFSPIDRAFVAKVIRAAKLKRASAPVESSERWPVAWPHAKIDKLPEVYSLEFQNGGLRHLWVDPKGNRIFAEFLGT